MIMKEMKYNVNGIQLEGVKELDEELSKGIQSMKNDKVYTIEEAGDEMLGALPYYDNVNKEGIVLAG